MTNTNTVIAAAGPSITALTRTTTTTTTSGSFHSHVSDFILRVGLNYRFGGPLVAKY